MSRKLFFSKYDPKLLLANCSCYAKESSSSLTDITIDKAKLIENFKYIKNFVNLSFLICYKKLFNKAGIINNIGAFLLAGITFLNIISIFIFFINQFSIIKKKIKDIIFGIKEYKIIESNKKRNNIVLKSGTKKHKNSNEKKVVVSKNMNKKVLGQKNNNKRNIKAIHINKDNKFIYNITNKEIKKNHNYFIKTNTINAKIIKRKNLDIEKKMQDNINKTKNIMEYTDEEINILPYNLALKYDKRSYCNFYISLLKTKHKLIFALYNNDYNSRIIKISLFLIEFTIDYVVNALFYNDDTMHKIYESKGQFDLEVQIPIIVYSSLISMLLNKPLCLLALSNDAIINFK